MIHHEGLMLTSISGSATSTRDGYENVAMVRNMVLSQVGFISSSVVTAIEGDEKRTVESTSEARK